MVRYVFRPLRPFPSREKVKVGAKRKIDFKFHKSERIFSPLRQQLSTMNRPHDPGGATAILDYIEASILLQTSIYDSSWRQI